MRSEGLAGKSHLRAWLIGAGVLVVILAGGAFFANSAITRYVRERVVVELGRHFDADVHFDSLDVTVLPEISAAGRGFVLQKKDRPGFVIRIGKFSARTGWLRVLSSPRHVQQVRLDELEIQIPPRNQPPEPKPPKPRKTDSPVVVDHILSDNATVLMLPKESWKEPLRFSIHQLKMQSVGLDRPAPFEATLTNPKPPGEIQVAGNFGPWRTDDAGQTPLNAKYTFRNANLGTFHGISGILSSTGQFGGVLEHLDVNGETDVPDFEVSRSGHKVHLTTKFHAIVDGTNGNTMLEPVDAHFLGSGVLASGGVVKPDQRAKGRTVALDVTVDHGRVEDMIRLATKTNEPVLTGPIRFTTKFNLPPGEGDIMDRLELAGQFGIHGAQFTGEKLREKVESLSRHGQGTPEDRSSGSDVTDFRGRFSLHNGVLRLPDLTFAVEGAAVKLNGTYGLRTEELNFRGHLRMDATLSDATNGVKSLLLKLVDPLFKKKNAGAVIPIKISGTREKPSFGLDLGAVVHGI